MGLGMRMTILALALFLCARQLQASLGDTETDLIKRYGPKLGTFVSDSGKFSTEEFEFQGYHVSVTLLDRVSGKETFTRLDKKPLDLVELQILLDGNSLGSKWEKKDDNETVTIWVLESKEAFAGYYKSLHSFTVKTSEMLAMEEALLKLQQQQQESQATQDPIKRNLRP